MRYRLLENGQPTENVILADEDFMSANYLPGTYVLDDVQDAQLDMAPRYLTKLGFRNRFTAAEKVAIEIACLDDPAAPMAQRQQAAMLRASQADQRDATYINPQLPETRAGVLALESVGILAAGRALEILDAYVQDHELFRG